MRDASLSGVVRIAPNVIHRELEGEAIILNLDTGIYFGLNAVGTRVWRWLEQGGGTFHALCDVLEAEYDVERARLEGDLLQLVGELREKELVVVEP